MYLNMSISLHYHMTLAIQRRKTVKMNTMLWGICVMGILVTLTYSAPNGKHRGHCEIDDDCMDGYVCMAPGYGKASDKAKKKCYPDETPCCPHDWTLNNNSCYFVAALVFVNQTDAIAYCDERGAYLVAAETPAENAFIVGMLQDMGVTGWIRLGLSNDGSGYTWDYTGLAPTYTDWLSSTLGNDCASYSASQGYRWLKDRCSYNRKIICEKTCP